MLSLTDRTEILRAATQKGFTQAELYFELTRRTHITLHGRIEEVRINDERGVSLRLEDGHRRLEYSHSAPSKEALLAFIEGRPVAATPKFEKATASVYAPKQILATLFHAAGLDTSHTPRGVLRYEDCTTHFEVTSLERNASGYEEHASLDVHWTATTETGSKSHRWQKSRQSIQGLLNELDGSEVLKRRVHASLHPKASWPAPSGELSVVWSSRATAKVFLHFLRAFEGDQFLHVPSFLAREARNLGVSFSIDEAGKGIDHEGSERKDLLLFNGGRPKALATDREVADQLEVASTGHSRRSRFDRPSTVGLWSPRVSGIEVRPNLMEGLERAIAVEDIEILDYDLRAGTVRLLITEARLVHQGERGEAIDPVELAVSLPDLLREFQVFSPLREKHGFWISKKGQRFLTELETPSILTPRFTFPGTVPETHYW